MPINSGQRETSTQPEPFWGAVFGSSNFAGWLVILNVTQMVISGNNNWYGLPLLIGVLGVLSFFTLRWVRNKSTLSYGTWDRLPARPFLVSALFWGAFGTVGMFVLGLVSLQSYGLSASSFWAGVVTIALLGGLWTTFIAALDIRYERGFWERTTAS